MKIPDLITLSIFLMLIPAYSYSQDYMSGEKNTVTPYVKEKPEEKSNSAIPENASGAQTEPGVSTENDVKVHNEIKAQSICLDKDCRSNWPVLKCANYDNRPAGETGDEFCGQMDQTCMAVSIGGGQSFFDECSAKVNTVHRCRCCWVE